MKYAGRNLHHRNMCITERWLVMHILRWCYKILHNTQMTSATNVGICLLDRQTNKFPIWFANDRKARSITVWNAELRLEWLRIQWLVIRHILIYSAKILHHSHVTSQILHPTLTTVYTEYKIEKRRYRGDYRFITREVFWFSFW